MSQFAPDSKSNVGFTSVQAYKLAVITLVIGIAVGYFARGSATSAAPEAAQASTGTAPSGMGSAPAMGAPQLPSIGTEQQAELGPKCWRRPPSRC